MKTRKKFDDLKRKQHRKKDKKPIKKINTFSGRGYVKSASCEDVTDSELEKRMIELTIKAEEQLKTSSELKEKTKEVLTDVENIDDFVCGNPDINCGGNCQCGTIDSVEVISITQPKYIVRDKQAETTDNEVDILDNKEYDDNAFADKITDIIDSNNADILQNLKKERIKHIIRISILISIGYGLSCIVKTIKN